MTLSEREKAELKALIDADQPLPARYRNLLFADAPEVELIWQGKTREVTNVVLPFQTIEQIDEPRDEGAGQEFSLFNGRQVDGWTNKLIWGDNKLVLSALKNGPLRKEIEAAGGIKLIYIDPPFDVGANFTLDIEIGSEQLTKDASMLEELAYRDTWGRGTDSYLSMLWERLSLAKSLMSPDASIYVHVGWQVSGYVRMLLDEVFGAQRLVNELIWQRTSTHNDSTTYGNVHDTILFYSISESKNFTTQYSEYRPEYIEQNYRQIDSDGRRFTTLPLHAASGTQKDKVRIFNGKELQCPPGKFWRWSQSKIDEGVASGLIVFSSTGNPRYKKYLDQAEGVPAQSIWADVRSTDQPEYATQKPENLLSRILGASSNPDDIVLDFFCGSGTTMAVAEKLGRKWIGCDLGRFAIHTSRKRLIGVQRELKKAGKPYRSFEILNLGKYERQWFIGVDPTLPEDQRQAQSKLREEAYLDLICQAYKVTRVPQHAVFHGRRGDARIVVGPVDAPVTESLVHQALDACVQEEITACDVLGFDWEMGLTPRIQEEAKRRGVDLALKYIPRDVFDKRAVEKGEVQFYDVAYVEADITVKQRTVRVSLTDFGVHYRQDDLGRITDKLKPGGSKVIVDQGQVQKLTKAKDGTITTEVLTKQWTDWIDYWAVDFDHESRQELIRALDDNGNERQYWTGNFIFENEWQSYRTRKDRTLELTSATHEYPSGTRGKKKIAVKVIDIFGNDTTRVFEVQIK